MLAELFFDYTKITKQKYQMENFVKFLWLFHYTYKLQYSREH